MKVTNWKLGAVPGDGAPKRVAKVVFGVAARGAHRDWLERNAKAIAAYNRDVGRHGCFGDSLRSF